MLNNDLFWNILSWTYQDPIVVQVLNAVQNLIDQAFYHVFWDNDLELDLHLISLMLGDLSFKVIITCCLLAFALRWNLIMCHKSCSA
jgi:hypothetical protein